MINGDLNDFLDGIHWGQEIWLKYKGVGYFLQGWNKDGMYHLCRQVFNKGGVKIQVDWEVVDEDNDVCVKAFLDAPIWDGKKFFDVEREIKWIEEWDCIEDEDANDD